MVFGLIGNELVIWVFTVFETANLPEARKKPRYFWFLYPFQLDSMQLFCETTSSFFLFLSDVSIMSET